MKVEELLSKKHIDFKTSGKDFVVKCLNPEHEDRHPSMRIDRISGVFVCPSCSFSGDIYKYFNINKSNILDIRIIEILEKIKNINGNNICVPEDAIPFVRKYRGISGQTFYNFEAFTCESLKELEARIVFPIKNIHGNIVGLVGRYIHSDLEPKYKIYPSEARLPLYPAKIKPIQNSIILVEGIFDMLNLHDKGLTNAVCTFGTAFGTPKKEYKKELNLERLSSYKLQGADTIYIMYDGDLPGKKAAEKLQNYISKNFIVDIIELPEDKDPGSMTKDEVKQLKELLYG